MNSGTKQCPYCAEEIKSQAIKCRFCGSALARPASRQADVPYADQPGRLSTTGWLLIAAVLSMAFMGFCGLALTMPSSRSSPRPAPRAEPVLELGDWNWDPTPGGNYMKAEGQVTNISNQPLRSVTAVVTYTQRDGTFITSDQAVIDFNPILPGQTSPWSTMTTLNPAMARASVEFKQIGGGKLNHRVKQ